MTNFSDLREIAPLSTEDDPCVQALARVLEEHGATGRFGITLLHEHFALEPGELLVETCDPTTRTLTIRPRIVDAANTGDRLLETSWSLEPGASAAALVCRVGCFVDLKDRHRRTHDRVWG